MRAHSPDPRSPNFARIIETLNRHAVEYLVVGGVAGQTYGAVRLTKDFDCLARRTSENFVRLAAAMRELNARLHVEGLSDEEAVGLPVQLHPETFKRMEISTWRTDAGDLDILVDIPDRQGRHRSFGDLVGRARHVAYAGVAVSVAGLADIIASKEWADRPKDREALPELKALLAREQSAVPVIPPPPTPAPGREMEL